MFFVLSKILDLAFAPMTWAVVLVLAGLRDRTSRRSHGLTIAGVLVLLVFSLEPVSNALLSAVEMPARPRPAPGTYDAIVLLGGAIDPWASEDHGVRAYNGSVERLIVTAELAREGVAPLVLVSGGRTDPRDRVIEAVLLRDELVSLGIDRGRIGVEGRSRNTRENAVETKALALGRGARRLLLVTSAAHMPRALEAFRAVGLDVDPFPVDFRAHDGSKHAIRLLPRAAHLAESTGALRELFGRLVYRMTFGAALVGRGRRS